MSAARFLGLLLVATDGSETGERAVTYAVALALRYRSELVLCFAIDHAAAVAECSASNGGGDLLMPLVQDLDDAGQAILADAAKRATAAGLLATTALVDGRAPEAIVACATERHADAIVMGTRGRGVLEELLLGSTAHGVLRRAEVPVFVIPPGTGSAEPAFDPILVAVDASGPSDAATAFALDLAAQGNARLVFCSVAQTRDMLDGKLRETASAELAVQTGRAGARRLPFESFVVEGEPADEIVKAAEARRAGTIVAGTHGRRGLQRLFAGSVAESIVVHSPVPVVVVRNVAVAG